MTVGFPRDFPIIYQKTRDDELFLWYVRAGTKFAELLRAAKASGADAQAIGRLQNQLVNWQFLEGKYIERHYDPLSFEEFSQLLDQKLEAEAKLVGPASGDKFSAEELAAHLSEKKRIQAMLPPRIGQKVSAGKLPSITAGNIDLEALLRAPETTPM